MFKFIKSSAFLNIIGTIIFSLCCAFISSYEFPKLELSTALKLIFNPYVWLGVGILVYVWSGKRIYDVSLEKDQEISDLSQVNRDLEEETRKNYSELEKLRKKLNLSQELLTDLNIKYDDEKRNKVKDWLKGLYKQIDLSSYDRISIYCVVDGKEFHLVNRYSKNPELSKSNTKSYILDKGVLYKAWCHGLHLDNECPLFSDEKKDEYYLYISEKYNYHIDELENMKMKSCRYFGLAIEDKNENIGVILFESINEKNLHNETVEKIKDYCSNYHDYLCSFLREYITDINIDKDKKEALKDNDPDEEILATLKSRGDL